MTEWPGKGQQPGDASGWVDPDAPTGLAPQHQRPAPGVQPPGPYVGPPQPPPAQPWPVQHPPPLQAPPLQAPPRQAMPGPAPWPQQPPPPQPWPPNAPGGNAFGAPYPYPPPGPPPPGSSRKPLILGGIAVGVVIVIVLAIVGITSIGGDGDDAGGGTGLSARDTVTAYLEALKSGDAEKALSYGKAQPASTDLLTDAVLKKQQAQMPISNIRVLDEDNSLAAIGNSTVHVAVNFGQVTDDVQLRLAKGDDGDWKLETAAVKLDQPSGYNDNRAEQTVTVFGKSLDKGALYVFPGAIEVASTNRYLKVTAEPLLLDAISPYSFGRLSPQISMNDQGTAAIQDALAAAFANCQKSNSLDPPGCPAKVRSSDAAEGTAAWGPADLSGVTISDMSNYTLSVPLGGVAKMPLSYRTISGGIEQGVATAYIGGSADISKTPPLLNFS